MQETAYLSNRSDLLGIVRKIPLFESYSDPQLMELLSLSRMRKFEPGEFITRQGEYDSRLYIVLSGSVDIEADGTAVARITQAGQTIGEMALVDGEARSASARAITQTTALAIDMSVTDRMSGPDRERFEAVFYRLLSRILVNRLRRTTQELAQAKNNVKELTGAILEEGVSPRK
jgi:CRP-like cAMP-binding protein